jgi:hypothetical protein
MKVKKVMVRERVRLTARFRIKGRGRKRIRVMVSRPTFFPDLFFLIVSPSFFLVGSSSLAISVGRRAYK